MSNLLSLRSLVCLVGLFAIIVGSTEVAYGQATAQVTATDPRHETLSQRIISVLFDLTIQSVPAPPTNGWSVTVNGGPVIVNAVVVAGTRVFVQIDASAAHAGEAYIKPGDVVQVSYDPSVPGSQTKTNGSGLEINAVVAAQSKNNWVPDCSDVGFFQSGNIPLATVKVCSPVIEDFYQWQYYLSLRIRNSTLYGGGNFIHEIVWGDGSPTTQQVSYQSDIAGTASATFIAPAALAGNPALIMTSRPTHNYPATLPGTGGDCSWNVSATPALNFAAYTQCFGALVTSNIFATYDTDNKNTGTLNLPAFVPNTDRVCLGSNVNMRFTDNTLLNCRSAIETTVPNQQARSFRIVYGSQNYVTPSNIPDVRVTFPATMGGATVQVTNNNATGSLIFPGGYFPTTGTASPDFNGVITLSAPVTLATATTYMGTIKTTLVNNQAVGQRFYIRMDYWDVCNPYDGVSTANAESISNYVEIVTKPATLQTAGLTRCYDASNGKAFNFTATTPAGGMTAINWYKNSTTGVPPVQTGVGLTFPAASYTVGNGFSSTLRTDNVNGAYYSAWVTQVVGATNSCESDPLEVVFVQQPQLTTPLMPTGTTPVCNGDAVLYTEPTAAPTRTINAATFTNAAAVNLITENAWTHGFGAGTTLTPSAGNSTTVTFGIAPQPATSTTNNVSVGLQYKAATVSVTTNFPAPAVPASFTYSMAVQSCATPTVNKSVQVFGTSAAGAIAPATQTICVGSGITNIVSSATVPLPIRGSIIRWERQTNGGGFVTDGTLGVASTVTPSVPLVAGAITTYDFRAVYQNGPCSFANGPSAQVIVNPKPTSATLSGNATICSGNITNLVVTVAGGTTATYTVVYNPGAVTVAGYTSGNNIPVSPGASTTYSLVSVTDSRGCTASALSGTPTVTVQNAPAITTQPVAATICEDASTSYTVVATGTTLTYQWQRDPNTGTFVDITDGVTDGATVYTNSTTATLNIDATGTGVTLNNYKYRVVVSGVCPPSVTSASRTLTVNPKASITTQPVAGANLCINGTKTYTVVAAGTPTLFYQWQRDPNTGTFANITNGVTDGATTYSNATTATLTINTTGLAATLDNYKYRVIVNSTGCPAAVTSVSQTLVMQGPTTTITQGTTGSVCAGNNFPLNGTEAFLNGVAVSRVWTGTFDENFAAPPAIVALTNGQLDAILTDGVGGSRRTQLNPIFNSIGLGAGKIGTYVLTLTSTDNNGCTNSATITMTVSQVGAAILYGATAGTISQNNLNAQTCSGNSVFLDGNPSGGSGTFAGGVSAHTWTKVSGPGGAIGTLLSATNIQKPIFTTTTVVAGATEVYVLRYFVQDNVGCNFITSPGTDITITVNPLPVANAAAPAPVCSTVALGTTAVVDLTLNNATINSVGGNAITWFTDAALTASIASPTTATVTNAVAVYAKVTTLATGCFSSRAVTYTVNPTPAPPTGPSGSTYCSSGPPTPISVSAPGGGLTIDWYSAASGGVVLAGGSGTSTFTPPVTGATTTYFAEVRNTATSCLSLSRLAVVSTIDNTVATASAGINQPNARACDANVTMAAAAVGGSGVGAWTVNNKVAYYQNFTAFADGTTFSSAYNGWTIDISNPNAFPLQGGGGSFQVTGNRFEAINTNGALGAGGPNRADLIWYSKIVDVTGMNVSAFVDVVNISGGLAGADDNISVFYRLNGAAVDIPFTTNGTNPGNFTSGTASVTGITGNTSMQIVIKVRNDGVTNNIGFDNVIIRDATASTIVITNPNSPTTTISGLPAPAAGAAPITSTLKWTTSSQFGVCPDGTSTMTVTINPTPLILAGQTTASCSGNAVNYEILLSPTPNFPAGTTFTWADPDGVGPATAKTIAADPAGTFHITDVLTNTTGAPFTVTYNVVPTSALGCAGASTPVIVTVRPAPKLNLLQAKTICSGQSVNYEILMTPVNAPAGTTYSWPDPDGAGPATAKTIAADPAGTNHITDVLTNFTAAPFNVTYAVTPTGPAPGNCPGAPQNIVITVNPKPPANPVTGSSSVCAGATVLLYQVTPNAGSTYAWTVPAPFVKFGGGTVTDFFVLVQFPAVGSGNITMTETNSFPGLNCTGPLNSLTVNVANAPGALSINGADPVCKNQIGVAYSVASPTPGSTYNWTASGATITSASSGPNLTTISVNFSLAAAATITVSEVSTSGCTGTPFTKNITVSDIPTMSSANSQSICSGVTPSLAFAATVPSNFSWVVTSITGAITAATAPVLAVGNTGTGNLGATFTAAQALVNNSAAVGSVTFDVTPATSAAPFCQGPTQSVVITVNPKPVIPAQTATICSGATFTIMPADGSPTAATIVPTATSYTWTAPVVSGGITGGSAQAVPQPNISQTLTNPTNSVQNAIYTVTPISGAAGTCPGTAFTVTVTVNPKPVIPAQAATICSGTSFTVTPANGVPAATTIVPAGTTYTWGAPIVTGAITGGSAQVVGQPNISQTLTNPTSISQTATYTVTPTSGAAGACIGSTFNVTVTVNPTPAIPIQTTTVCSATAFIISPADGSPTAATIVPASTTYTWTAPVVTGGLTGGSAQPAPQATISQTLSNPTSAPQTATYTVTPTSGAAGSCVGSTFTVTVTVNPSPAIPAQAQTICSGGTFSLTPANGVPTAATVVPSGTTYTWTNPAVTGGVTGGSAQAVGQPLISQTLTNPTNAVQTATYTVTPTSGAAGACVGPNFTFVVTVNPMPVIPAQAATICSGAVFTVTPADGIPTAATIVPAATTYTWTAPVVTGGVTGGSAQAVAQPNISQTLTNPTNLVQTATYTVTPKSGAAGACVGANFTLTVNVNPKPVIANQTPSICSGTAFTIAPSDGVPSAATIVPAGTTYTWGLPVATGGVTGSSAQAAPQPNISQTLTNPTNAVQTVTYTVTPTSGAAGACVGSTFTITVTVNPKPVIPAQSATICSGNAFSITPADGVPAATTIVPASTTYTWPAPVVSGGITGSSAQLAGVASIGQTLTNPTSIVQTATYTVTPTSGAAGACIGATFTVTVTVNPKPVIPNQTTVICGGTAFSITPIDGLPTAATIVPLGTTYAWGTPVVTGGITGGSPQAGQASVSQVLTNPTNVNQTATYTVTPTSGAAGACVGSPFTIIVTVNPVPTIPNQATSICSGTAFTIAPSNGSPTAATVVPGGTTYTWTNPVITGGVTGASSQGTGQPSISQTLTNPTNTPQTVTYTVTPTSGAGGSCVGATFQIVVTVTPVPAIPSQMATICSASAFTVNPANGVPTGATIVPAGTTYTWTAPVVTGGLTGGSAQAVGQPNISQTLTNPTNSTQIATYAVTPQSGSCTGANFTIIVSVSPKPAIPAQSVSICSATSFTIAPVDGVPTIATIVPSGTTYTWTGPVATGGVTGSSAQPVPQSSISQTLTNPTNTAQTVTYTVTPVSGSCTGSTFTITVNVNPKPFIPDQTPTICSGTAFIVNPADGVPTASTIVPAATTYSWPVPVVTGGVTGATAQSGQPSIGQMLGNPTNTPQTATYTVTPTSGASGTCVGATFTITVTVNPKPSVPAQSPVICSGSAFTVSPVDGIPTAATIVPAGTTYTWPAPAVTGGITGGSAQVAGVASISQTLTNPTNTVQIATYSVTPTSGAAGLCVGSTFTVTVTVNPKPVIPAQISTICSGTLFTITPANGVPTAATIVPTGTTYTWPAPVVTGGVTGVSAQLIGVASISQTLTNPTNISQTATYTVTPTSGASGSCVGATFTVTVTVNPQPVIPNQSTAICSGTAFTVNPANGVPTAATIVPSGTTYTWPAPVVTGGVLGGSAQGIGQPTISQALTNPTNIPQTATYTVTPTSGAAGNCVGANFTITVTVNPKPAITNQTPAICSGSTFTVSPSDGLPTAATIVPAGTTYTWPAPAVSGGVTGSSAQAAGVASISQTLTNPTNIVQTVTYTVTPTSGAAGACVGSAFTVTVTVNPQPVIPNQVATICSGSMFTTSPVNGAPTAATIVPAGTTYSWAVPIVTGGITGGSAQAGQASISQTLTNPTNVAQTATYTVIPTSGTAGSCVGASFTITVTVNPKPVIPAQTTAICSGAAFSITPVDGLPSSATIVPTGTTYTWTAPIVTGGVTGSSAQAIGVASIGQTLTNPTNTVQTVTYTVTPTSGAAGLCVGATFNVTVTVNPKPVIFNQTPAICSGTAFSVSPTNSVPTAATIVPTNTTYTWPAPVVTGGVTGSSAQTSQTSISQTLVNPTNTVQTVTYTVTPTSGAAGACVGAPFTITVSVNPVPAIPAQTATVCSGTVFNITPANGSPSAATIVPAGTTYTWAVPIVTGGLTGGSAQTGQTSISETLTNPSNSVQSATYTVTPTSGAAGACVGSPFTVTVTVNPKPVIPNQAQTVCSGVAFSITPVDGVPSSATIVPASTKYTWTAPIVTGGMTGASAQAVPQNSVSQTLANPTSIAQTATYTVTPISGAAGACVGATFQVTITVNPVPVATAGSIQRCSGASIAFNIQDMVNNVAPFTGGNSVSSLFTFAVTVVGPSTGLDVSPNVFPGTFDRTVASAANITQTFTNVTNHDVTIRYTVTPFATVGNCAGTPFTLDVIYHPEPVGSNLVVAGCSSTLNHNIQTTQITNGLASIFTYVVSSSDETNVPTPPALDRVVASNALITDTFTNPTSVTVTVTYTITPFNAANPSCAGTPFTYKVDIGSAPRGSSSTKGPVCSDTPFTIDPQSNITNGVISTFTWTAAYDPGLTGGAASGSGIISMTLTNVTAVQKNVVYTVTPFAGPCAGIPSTFTITQPVNPEPVMDPTLATKTICSTNPTSLNKVNITLNTNGVSVAAANYNITLKSQDPGLTGTPTTGPALAPGAIVNDTYNNVLAIPQKVVYTIVPVAASGCLGDPFDITVTVNPEPVISASLNNTVCSTNISNIILATNGISVGAASYRIVNITVPGGLTPGGSNAPNGSVSGSINMIKNDTYTNNTAGSLIAIYDIRATSASGCEGASRLINLTVNPAPLVDPALNPTPVCSGVNSGVTLVVAPGSVAAASYNISAINYAPSANFLPGGANAPVGTGQAAGAIFNDNYANTTGSPVPVLYSIAAVSAAGCVGPVQIVTLTINPAPDLANTLNRTVCSTNATGISFSVTGSPAAVSYNVNSVVIAGGLVTGGGNVAIPGLAKPSNYIAADTYSNPGNTTLTVLYNVAPIAATGCIGPQKTITLTVEPTIKAAPINHLPTICSSSGPSPTATDVELLSPTVPSAGTMTFNYTAVSSIGTQITGFVPALTNLAAGYRIQDALVNNSNTVAFVTYTITPMAAGAKSGAGCTGAPVNVVVNVEPRPKLIPSPSTKTVCEGSAIGISLTTTTVPGAGTVEYRLVTAVATGGVTGMTPNNTVFLATSTLNDVLSSPSTTTETVTYTFRPRINGGSGCIGDDVVVTVNVNPRPNISAVGVPAAICSGDQINISIVSDVSSTVSTWPAPTTAPTAGSVTGGSAGAGDQLFQILFNKTSPVVQTVTYLVTPQASGCAGTPLTISVPVNPVPNVLGTSTTTICSGSTLNVPLTSKVTAGVNFTWTVDDPSGLGAPGAFDGSGTTINQLFTNSTGSQASLTYTITPILTAPGTTSGTCTGDVKIMFVTVAPSLSAAFLNSPAPDFICAGSTEYLVFQFGGQAPFDFTYTKQPPTGPLVTNTLTNKGPVVVVQDVLSAAGAYTYTITSVTSHVNGVLCTKPFSVPFVVNVGDTDPNFSIISPLATCSPNTVSFQYNQVPGTIYTWRFGDTADSVYTATTAVPGKVIKHIYSNLSPTSTLSYPVSMQTELPAPYPGCFKTTAPKTISIYPKIIANIIADRTTICSGETVRFSNQSVGATSQNWSFRVQGQIPETLLGSSLNISNTFTNNTASNPIVYEVIYRGTNGNCPTPDQIIPIQVYRVAAASFNEGTVPPFVNGQSIVNFTNTSSILDNSQFSYDWTFGSDSQPSSFSGLTPPAIKYVRPGPKNVTLTIINRANAFCKVIFEKQININLLPLVATFKAGPVESCFPAKIVVTESNITGDGIEWRVFDSNGRIAATSSAVLPTFNIPSEGKYTITLKTSSSLTGQVAVAQNQTVTVYAKPFASFAARPDVLYVPDTELTTFNFSTGANQYAWDFGDGGKSKVEEPKYIYKIEGIYEIQLIAMFDHGNNIICADTLKHQVVAKQGGVTKVPNAFTPNPAGPSGGVAGSGSFNDVFLPIVKGAEEFNLQIFDRWGNLIFESNSTQVGWDGYNVDGKLLPAGVYVYKLTIRLSDGQRSTQIGDVTMIR